jgi:hypothetical protein
MFESPFDYRQFEQVPEEARVRTGMRYGCAMTLFVEKIPLLC